MKSKYKYLILGSLIALQLLAMVDGGDDDDDDDDDDDGAEKTSTIDVKSCNALNVNQVRSALVAKFHHSLTCIDFM